MYRKVSDQVYILFYHPATVVQLTTSPFDSQPVIYSIHSLYSIQPLRSRIPLLPLLKSSEWVSQTKNKTRRVGQINQIEVSNHQTINQDLEKTDQRLRTIVESSQTIYEKLGTVPNLYKRTRKKIIRIKRRPTITHLILDFSSAYLQIPTNSKFVYLETVFTSSSILPFL